MSNLENSWHRIEQWAADNDLNLFEYLNRGASETELEELQRELGRTLPDDLLNCLRRHNGERDLRGALFVDMGAWLSAEDILRIRQLLIDGSATHEEIQEAEVAGLVADQIIHIDGPVRPLSYHPDWVPILDMNGDVFWMLDFAPPDGGTPGQVIRIDIESLDWQVVAPSFAAFLEAYVEALENDDVTFAAGAGFKALYGK